MPNPSQQLSTLVNAAKEHNIELSKDDLETIKNAPADSALSQWLGNFDASQLPSLEELEIWNYLQSSNRTLPKVHTAPREVLTDQALHRAVINLEASTQRLEAQTETLNAQHALLSRYSRRTQQQRSQLSAHIHALHRKSTLQAEHVNFANDEKITELKFRLRARFEQLEKETKGLQSRVAETLNGDDKSLGTLQGTIKDGASRWEQHLGTEHELERVELLLKALKKARVEEIKDRLDRVYLESLNGTSNAKNAGEQAKVPQELALATEVDVPEQPEARRHVSDLQSEIRTLYDEVNDVAAMLVDHEHGVPLRGALAALSRAEDEGRNRVLSCAIQNITVMTEELATLTREVEEQRSEKVVLTTMLKEVGGIEKATRTYVSTPRPGRTAAPKPPKALEELMVHLKLDQAGDVGRGSPQERLETSHEVIVHRLESAAQQRRASVSLLTDAASTTTNLENELKALERRIAEARAKLDS